jgi:AAA domain
MNLSKSIYLQSELQRLLSAIEALRSSGRIAPAYCWLTESTETKGSRTYTYIRLVTEEPGKKLSSKSLGRPGSGKHREWKAAIERREAIVELEQQLKMLDALIQRQHQANHLFQQLESSE